MIFSEIFISTKGMPSHFMMTQYGSKWQGGAKQKVHPVGSLRKTEIARVLPFSMRNFMLKCKKAGKIGFHFPVKVNSEPCD